MHLWLRYLQLFVTWLHVLVVHVVQLDFWVVGDSVFICLFERVKDLSIVPRHPLVPFFNVFSVVRIFLKLIVKLESLVVNWAHLYEDASLFWNFSLDFARYWVFVIHKLHPHFKRINIWILSLDFNLRMGHFDGSKDFCDLKCVFPWCLWGWVGVFGGLVWNNSGCFASWIFCNALHLIDENHWWRAWCLFLGVARIDGGPELFCLLVGQGTNVDLVSIWHRMTTVKGLHTYRRELLDQVSFVSNVNDLGQIRPL